MSLDLHAELAALRQLILSSKDDLSRYRGARSDACFATPDRIFFKCLWRLNTFEPIFWSMLHNSCPHLDSKSFSLNNYIFSHVVAVLPRKSDFILKMLCMHHQRGGRPRVLRGSDRLGSQGVLRGFLGGSQWVRRGFSTGSQRVPRKPQRWLRCAAPEKTRCFHPNTQFAVNAEWFKRHLSKLISRVKRTQQATLEWQLNHWACNSCDWCGYVRLLLDLLQHRS